MSYQVIGGLGDSIANGYGGNNRAELYYDSARPNAQGHLLIAEDISTKLLNLRIVGAR